MKRIIYLLIPVLIALTVLSCKRDYDAITWVVSMNG